MTFGDKVLILSPIADLQPKSYDCFKHTRLLRRQYGTIISIDGAYIYVRPKNRRWEVECYECELKIITKDKFKKCKNYARTKI